MNKIKMSTISNNNTYDTPYTLAITDGVTSAW